MSIEITQDKPATEGCAAAAGSVAAAESWLATVDRYIDEERLHDDENSFLEMDGSLLQVASSKYGSHYFRITLTPITSEEYFAPRSPLNDKILPTCEGIGATEETK